MPLYTMLLIGALGLEIADVDGEVVIIDVAGGGWADQTGLRPGQRILRVNGEPVSSIHDVETRLLIEPASGARSIDVESHPFGTAILRPNHRIGLLTFGHLRSSQPQSKSAWLGAYYGYWVLPVLSVVGAFGYAPLGRKAFVDGLNAFTFLFGIEYDQPIVSVFGFVVRALAGPNIRGHDSPWIMEPATATLHLGVRFWSFTVYAAGGFGPAQGFNAGAGIGFSFGFGEKTYETASL